MTLDNLLDLDLPALKAYCERLGEKSFRATQLFRWIHQRGVGDFDAMTDLARSLRAKLAGAAEVRPLRILTEKASTDPGPLALLRELGLGQRQLVTYQSGNLGRRPVDQLRRGQSVGPARDPQIRRRA